MISMVILGFSCSRCFRVPIWLPWDVRTSTSPFSFSSSSLERHSDRGVRCFFSLPGKRVLALHPSQSKRAVVRWLLVLQRTLPVFIQGLCVSTSLCVSVDVVRWVAVMGKQGSADVVYRCFSFVFLRVVVFSYAFVFD